jgi:hypothetical protein
VIVAFLFFNFDFKKAFCNLFAAIVDKKVDCFLFATITHSTKKITQVDRQVSQTYPKKQMTLEREGKNLHKNFTNQKILPIFQITRKERRS